MFTEFLLTVISGALFVIVNVMFMVDDFPSSSVIVTERVHLFLNESPDFTSVPLYLTEIKHFPDSVLSSLHVAITSSHRRMELSLMISVLVEDTSTSCFFTSIWGALLVTDSFISAVED